MEGDLAPWLRRAIHEAALAELIDRGIDKFTIAGVARRVGVEPSLIIKNWGDRRVLLMDAQLRLLGESLPPPDTGSLRGDLTALTKSLVALAATRDGRAWFRRLLSLDGDADLGEIRTDFWRVQLDQHVQILRRAAERGELRDGIDFEDAMRMLSASLYYDVIFSDTPVRSEYVEQTLDMFVRGLTA